MHNNKRVSAILRALKRKPIGNRPKRQRPLPKLTYKTRLYQAPCPIVAITGGIGSGKSTVAAIMQTQGLALLDADRLIKEIYALPHSIEFIRQIDTTLIGSDGKILFPQLRQLAFAHPQIKERLEHFLYQQLPLHFCQQLPNPLPAFVLYDVPLLFEKNLDSKVDAIICVSARPETQLARACTRDPQSSAATIESILRHQLPLRTKEERSHWVVQNDRGTPAELAIKVKKLVKVLIHHFGQRIG